MSHAELIRHRSRSTAATSASPAVGQSTTALRASCQVTASIKPIAATLTPSRNALIQAEPRRRGTIG